MFSLFVPFPQTEGAGIVQTDECLETQELKEWCGGGLSPVNVLSIPRASGALSCLYTCSPRAGPSARQHQPRRTGKVDIFGGQLTRERNPLQQWVQLESVLAASLGLLKSHITAFIRWMTFQKCFFVPWKGDSWSLSLPLHEVPSWVSRSLGHQLCSSQPMGALTRSRVGQEYHLEPEEIPWALE